MEILWGAEAQPSESIPTVVTVGMFDGVHLGHVELFDRVFADAKSLDARAAVVTFEPHPLEVLAPEHAPCVLTTIEQRLDLFERFGFDLALVLAFDERMALLSPADFTRATLVEELRVRKVIVGEDFRFGHKRAGDVDALRDLGGRFGFEAEAIGLVGEESRKISSSDIRSFIAEGNLGKATSLLGRDYRLAGTVVRGDGRGRTLGFPTANIEAHQRACLPAHGIYAGWWIWKDKRLPGAINVGVRPTFKADDRPLCEIYVLDFEGDLYGERGEVEFAAYLRGEERFDDAEALVAQIGADVDDARRILTQGEHAGDQESS